MVNGEWSIIVAWLKLIQTLLFVPSGRYVGSNQIHYESSRPVGMLCHPNCRLFSLGKEPPFPV